MSCVGHGPWSFKIEAKGLDDTSWFIHCNVCGNTIPAQFDHERYEFRVKKEDAAKFFGITEGDEEWIVLAFSYSPQLSP